MTGKELDMGTGFDNFTHTKISKICQREFWTTGHY